MNSNAIAAKRKSDSAFMKKGVTIAILSGVLYGFYTAFMTLGMSLGVWVDLYDPSIGEWALNGFFLTYVLSALGSATNDFFSAIWALLYAAIRGLLGDWAATLKTKPGLVMIIAALIGGPIASTCYVLALQLGGAVTVPFAALNATIGALIGHFVFKQDLTKRMVAGIIICLLAAALIGGTSFANLGATALAGCGVATICALGWGIEGAVCGFGTSLIDFQVGIAIRQFTSAIGNLVILLPLLALIGGEIGLAPALAVAAITDFSGSAIFLVISGFCAFASFACWYKGNGMCGAALGMVCNGGYAFWCPLCCWLILGLVWGIEGWSMLPAQWIGAIIMVIGIIMVGDINPLALLKKKEA